MELYDDKPTRCIDPVMKYCQGCEYGHNVYPEWIETREDLEWCIFETFCILGYDQGRPEDKPTEEELKEFDDWYNEVIDKFNSIGNTDYPMSTDELRKLGVE